MGEEKKLGRRRRRGRKIGEGGGREGEEQEGKRRRRGRRGEEGGGVEKV